MDIPPPPPPPSSDGIPPTGALPVGAPTPSPPDGAPPPGGHPAVPPPPSYESGAPYGGPPPAYPQGPYDQQSPFGAPGPGTPPPYPGQPFGAPGPGTPPPYPGQPYGGPGPYGAQGPYGAPGPYGYPAAPQGWYAERSTNGLAIASLVTALTCVPLVGLVLGIFGLRQVNRRGERGKGLAVAGITISSVMTLLTALVVVLAAVGAFDEGNTRVTDLRAGQCFNTVDKSLSDYSSKGTKSTSVNVLSCGDEHEAEVYRVFGAEPGSDGGYPGQDDLADQALTKCKDYAGRYIGGAPVPDGVGIYYYMPPKGGWNRGDHDVTCFFGSRSGQLTGSLKDAGDGNGDGFGV